jgi:hypothetical protein
MLASRLAAHRSRPVKKPAARPLSAKAARFVALVIADPDAPASDLCQMAGYSPTSAKRMPSLLLSDSRVQQALKAAGLTVYPPSGSLREWLVSGPEGQGA